jgi:hypothetical protein
MSYELRTLKAARGTESEHDLAKRAGLPSLTITRVENGNRIRRNEADMLWQALTQATRTLGSGGNGTVTVTADTRGQSGTALSSVVTTGVGNDVALSAAIASNIVTVTLGTDSGGVADDTKNTAVLAAAVIDALTGVSAAASGNGSGVIPTSTSTPFAQTYSLAALGAVDMEA